MSSKIDIPDQPSILTTSSDGKTEQIIDALMQVDVRRAVIRPGDSNGSCTPGQSFVKRRGCMPGQSCGPAESTYGSNSAVHSESLRESARDIEAQSRLPLSLLLSTTIEDECRRIRFVYTGGRLVGRVSWDPDGESVRISPRYVMVNNLWLDMEAAFSVFLFPTSTEQTDQL